MSQLATIGVYGFTLEEFLRTLRDADVRLVLDVRQRRGVRGPQYAWANSKRLQAALADAGIGYQHHPELAPTTELRQLQYLEDDRLGVGKRSREQLAPEYVERYTQGDPRQGRPRCAGGGATRRGRGGAALRRARSRGMSPLAGRRAHSRRTTACSVTHLRPD